MIEYDPHHWREHLFDWKGSLVGQIAPRVLVCGLWAGAVVAVNRLTEFHPAVPNVGHTLVGVALGLLLVFRTNASYDRFWEGRRQWGAITNICRNLARTATVWMADAPDLVRRVADWASALPYATMNLLRGVGGIGPAAAAEVEKSAHAPLAVARHISQALAEARRRGVLGEWQLVDLERHVRDLIDCVGACERIHRTPLPFAYVVHLRRAVLLYVFTLPFALVNDFGWAAVVVTLLVTFVLFGIEAIGVEIEDPFGTDDNDLPLEQFCEGIRRRVLDCRPAEDDLRPGGPV
jgi:putative membrane protein